MRHGGVDDGVPTCGVTTRMRLRMVGMYTPEAPLPGPKTALASPANLTHRKTFDTWIANRT
jgi:hypothetical protein